MGKLINLRHLITSSCWRLSYMPRGVENLRRLRTLNGFVVGGDVEGSQACSLSSLGNLKHLGVVELTGLRYVGDSAEAKRAQLYRMKNLIDLSLFFFNDWKEASASALASASASEIEKDGVVLEALQPPLNLERLYIGDYRGTSFPEWMMWLTQLKSLSLTTCIKCEQLPALGKLPSLEYLQIWGMASVKRVGNELLGIENATTSSSSSSSSFIAFPKLTKLSFGPMREWEDWDDEITRQITIMPSLSYLCIRDCSKLKALPQYILHATSLNTCDIKRCPKLEKVLPVARNGQTY